MAEIVTGYNGGGTPSGKDKEKKRRRRRRKNNDAPAAAAPAVATETETDKPKKSRGRRGRGSSSSRKGNDIIARTGLKRKAVIIVGIMVAQRTMAGKNIMGVPQSAVAGLAGEYFFGNQSEYAPGITDGLAAWGYLEYQIQDLISTGKIQDFLGPQIDAVVINGSDQARLYARNLATSIGYNLSGEAVAKLPAQAPQQQPQLPAPANNPPATPTGAEAQPNRRAILQMVERHAAGG